MKVEMSRLAIVVEYLQNGGEVNYDGQTFVWLDDYVTRETPEEQWVIDGLAVKSRKYKAGEDYNDPNAGEVHYMGMSDMSVNLFFEIINDIPRDEMVRIIRDFKRQREEAR